MSRATLDVATAPLDVRNFLAAAATAVDAELQRRLAVTGADPGRLREAMLYAATGGGKRLRPGVALATVLALRSSASQSAAALDMLDVLHDPHGLCVAAAVEMLHAYTLVHDDLPAMDDDDERRGRPTVHIAFGEAIAILAGDGLLTLALVTLAELGPDAGRAVATLGQRSGHLQLLAGQAIDLSTDKTKMAFAELTDLHAKKTGALFAAAAELGAIAAGAKPAVANALGDFGMALGIAFQHADDRDDQEFTHHAAAATQAWRDECVRAIALVRRHAGANSVLEQIAAWIGAQSTTPEAWQAVLDAIPAE